MSNILDTLVEIRDLLNKAKLPEKKKIRKPHVKRRPKWMPSEFPIERWKVGTTKIYPIDKKDGVAARVKFVNRKMKAVLHLPNHYLQCTVLKNGRLYVEVCRDR